MYLFLLIMYQLPAIVPTQVPAISFLRVSNIPLLRNTIGYYSPTTKPNSQFHHTGVTTRCFQSESAGRIIFSCSGPPYRFLSKDKLARSAKVTAVPAVTPVHRNALNGSGICA